MHSLENGIEILRSLSYYDYLSHVSLIIQPGVKQEILSAQKENRKWVSSYFILNISHNCCIVFCDYQHKLSLNPDGLWIGQKALPWKHTPGLPKQIAGRCGTWAKYKCVKSSNVVHIPKYIESLVDLLVSTVYLYLLVSKILH